MTIHAPLEIRVAKVLSAKLAEGTHQPCRVFRLDVGSLGEKTSVGQFTIVPEEDLVGRNVVVCCNLGTRPLGKYVSECLILGTPHPASPPKQKQAIPLLAASEAKAGDEVF